ncbi:YDG domain-containing protein [Acinetobacter sp. ANC 5414]|uniref:YDG domain-containing protein n=1 Tax=Acinetobacter sp. ANC 5414 TaxID=2731251 RepID=UPI00149089E8|nr:YDG domain-containing protein [Acinetobacter sp. ANC 5414]NNH01044.1 filamentous hemagglutinin N-terminal domain-containing protein [Acinetobacter sp. ANC 5414]
MNKIYRVIWNTQLGCWQAVSELAKNHNSSSKTSVTSAENDSSKGGLGKLFSSVLLFSFSLFPLSIHAAIVNNELPTGAQINSGSAQFSQAGNTLNIDQNSQNLSTNWNSFNIGQNATVNFNQPNQSSTAINHVLDSNASQIMGRLNANGQVFLLNPNGVVFSKTAQVNIGGLVASTLNLTDADIQNGKFTLKGDPNNTASIENHGTIHTANGGTVALIAPNVKNIGSIVTPNGTTHLTSASQVTLALQDGSLTQYQVNEGVLKGLVDNDGAIIAENGAIYLTAKAKDQLSKAVVNHTGLLEANRVSQNAKGEIILLGDMAVGETHVGGTLKAEGKNGADGGFIETSAAHVEIDANTQVSTASDTAKSGLWLIDPVDITIDGAKATAIQTALNSGDVTVTTANSATNSWGANGTGTDKGDIHVNSAITWSSNQALTLRADNDIHINANISANGANGKLHLQYGQTTTNTDANYYLNNGSKLNLQAGNNFSTKKGSEIAKDYTVITTVGASGSMTGKDLQGMNGNLTGNYVLGADIDASDTVNWNSGAGFNPIGSSSAAFTGVFDGLNHAVNGLTINRPALSGTGLIGRGSNVKILNVGLSNSDIIGGRITGALAGYLSNNSSIINSYTTGKIFTTSDIIGGILGAFEYGNSELSNSYSTALINGNSIANSMGGLIGGSNSNTTINNSYFAGTIENGNRRVGGILGDSWNNNQININNSYSIGKLNGNNDIGSLVGGSSNSSSLSNLNISNSFWNIETTGLTKGVGVGTSTGVLGLTTAQMQDLNTFKNAGWDIDGIGGTGKIWRIYDGQTAPLLRSFLTQTTINPADQISTYNGQVQGLNTSIFTGLDSSKIYSSLSNSKNVGTYNLSYYSGQQGYDLIGNTINLIINKAVINAITGITANNKTYDGTTDATLNIGSADFAGMIAGDNLTVASSTGSFSDKNAGTDKTVNISGLSLGGADAENYLLASTTATNIANITPATLTATITAQNKVYDAGTSAVVTYGDNRLGSDDLTVSGTANFSDKNVANGKTVTATSLSLNGADAHNYELVNSTAQTTADISKANINNITGITADNRAYNGLTAASLNSNDAQFNGMYAGDDLSVATATGQFDTATTGQAKTVSITGLSLGGADAQNYNLVDTTALTTADINMLTPANYLQAIQLRRPRYLPETNNALNTVDLDVRQGGVNTSGIQALTGEY